jgi:hypothetical protein
VDRQLADSGARLLVAEDGAAVHLGVATLAVSALYHEFLTAPGSREATGS